MIKKLNILFLSVALLGSCAKITEADLHIFDVPEATKARQGHNNGFTISGEDLSRITYKIDSIKYGPEVIFKDTSLNNGPLYYMNNNVYPVIDVFYKTFIFKNLLIDDFGKDGRRYLFSSDTDTLYLDPGGIPITFNPIVEPWL